MVWKAWWLRLFLAMPVLIWLCFASSCWISKERAGSKHGHTITLQLPHPAQILFLQLASTSQRIHSLSYSIMNWRPVFPIMSLETSISNTWACADIAHSHIMKHPPCLHSDFKIEIPVKFPHTYSRVKRKLLWLLCYCPSIELLQKPHSQYQATYHLANTIFVHLVPPKNRLQYLVTFYLLFKFSPQITSDKTKK